MYLSCSKMKRQFQFNIQSRTLQLFSNDNLSSSRTHRLGLIPSSSSYSSNLRSPSRSLCARASGVDGSQPLPATSSGPSDSPSAAFALASDAASQASVQYPTDSPMTHAHAHVPPPLHAAPAPPRDDQIQSQPLAACQGQSSPPLTGGLSAQQHHEQMMGALTTSHPPSSSSAQPNANASMAREVPVVQGNKGLTVWEKGKAFANVAWTGTKRSVIVFVVLF
jgi:hypothetical protein